ncbi:MAG: nucleotide pyrophosphohydrolase [Candidatus Hodarchaeota archaeon]
MEIEALLKKVIEFRDERDWAQYHNPKDLAISISLEAAELLEIFQWKNPQEVQMLKSDVNASKMVKEELGDIMIYTLTLAHEFDLDPTEIILDKIQINDKKYPKEKVKGKSDKYTAY